MACHIRLEFSLEDTGSLYLVHLFNPFLWYSMNQAVNRWVWKLIYVNAYIF